MNVDDFLQIYKYPFYKLNFIGVKFIDNDVNDNGRKFFNFIGVFEFIPPDDILNDSTANENKKQMLKDIKKSDKELLSLVFRKKFTRKIQSGDDKDKWKFEYVFDFSPKNIVDYDVLFDKGVMRVKVNGYGMF